MFRSLCIVLLCAAAVAASAPDSSAETQPSADWQTLIQQGKRQEAIAAIETELRQTQDATAAASLLWRLFALRFGLSREGNLERLDVSVARPDFDAQAFVDATILRDASSSEPPEKVAGERAATLRQLLAALSKMPDHERTPENMEQKRSIHRILLLLPGLDPQHREHNSFGIFSAGTGCFLEGARTIGELRKLQMQTQRDRKRHAGQQQQRQAPREIDKDIRDGVNKHLMLMLLNMLEAHLTNFMRELLKQNAAMARSLERYCGVAPITFTEGQEFRQSEVSDMLVQCLLKQNAFPQLAADGADVNFANPFGWTPLHYVAMMGDTRLAQQLLDLGAKPNLATSLGFSSLHVAVMRGRPAVLRLLVASGGDLAQRDSFGRTPAELARLTSQRWTDNETREFCELLRLSSDCASFRTENWPSVEHSQQVPQIVLERLAKRELELRKQFGDGGWRVPAADWLNNLTQTAFDASAATVSIEVPASGFSAAEIATSAPKTSQLQQSQQKQPCDFDVRYSLTTDEFVREYLSVQRPVLIKGLLSDPSESLQWHAVLRLLSRASLLERFGNIRVKVGAIPYAKSFGLGSFAANTTSFVDYLDRQAGLPEAERDFDPAYLFEVIGKPRHPPNQRRTQQLRTSGSGDIAVDGGKQAPTYRLSNSKTLAKPQPQRAGRRRHHGEEQEGPDLDQLCEEIFVWPSLLDPSALNITTDSGVQFYLGPPNSGAPIHFHNNAWNALDYGRKKWFLFPPRHAIYSKTPIHSWIRDELPKLQGAQRPLECVQEQGDVLFVPDSWAHGVLNLAESIGYAAEFRYGANAFKLDVDV